MSCRNLLGLLELRSSFVHRLETESGIPCIDPSGCGGFGRMADQSPLTGCDPKNLVVIPSQQHADQLSFQEKQFQYRLQRRAHLCRFWCHRHPGCGNAPPLLTQEREVNPCSASVLQHALASGICNTRLPEPTSCGALQQSVVSKGERDRELASVSSQEQERFLSDPWLLWKRNLESSSRWM